MQLDPLTKSGVFDSEFYTSEDYDVHVTKAKNYLKREGFDTIQGEFVVKIQNRTWIVRNLPLKFPKSQW